MRTVWTIESSDPREFCYASCIAVTPCIVDDRYEFDSFEKAVTYIPQLQAKDPDLDFPVDPHRKLRHGYASSNDARRKFFPGRITAGARANGCLVSDWVHKTIGDYRYRQQET